MSMNALVVHIDAMSMLFVLTWTDLTSARVNLGTLATDLLVQLQVGRNIKRNPVHVYLFTCFLFVSVCSLFLCLFLFCVFFVSIFLLYIYLFI